MRWHIDFTSNANHTVFFENPVFLYATNSSNEYISEQSYQYSSEQ